MQKITLFVAALIFLSARSPLDRPGEWMTLQQAQDSIKGQPKVIIMDIYTDWCYWCKVMENNTYSKPEVSSYMHENFYAVKFNAENKNTVLWKGKSFAYNPSYRVNDLALSLTKGQLSFPTTVIITPDNQPPQFIAGYLKPSELEPILKYFGEGAYKKISFQEFNKDFHVTWK
jgi:thioredoxin-related protein